MEHMKEQVLIAKRGSVYISETSHNSYMILNITEDHPEYYRTECMMLPDSPDYDLNTNKILPRTLSKFNPNGRIAHSNLGQWHAHYTATITS